MKYRKKPVVVEAVQFFSTMRPYPAGVILNPLLHDKPFVITIHGEYASVVDGDWIITEPDGIHHYPCKPDIFAQTYELAE